MGRKPSTRSRARPNAESAPVQATPAEAPRSAEAPELEEGAAAPAEASVPGWLAAVILLLVLVSVAATGFALRGFISRSRASSQVAADVQVWEKRVSDAPADTRARLELGQAYTRAERYQDAMDQFDRVLQTNPQDIGALYGRGVALQQLGEEKKAEAAFWEVLKIDDGHVGSATELGRMYAARGHYRSLIEAVRPASQRYPSAAELQYLMGLAYENLGRTDWAKARYELALTASPDMREAREALDRLEGSQ